MTINVRPGMFTNYRELIKALAIAALLVGVVVIVGLVLLEAFIKWILP